MRMKLQFDGKPEGLTEGIRALASDLNIDIGPGGVPVRVEQRQGPIEVGFADGAGFIKYEETIHFFRALGLLAEALSTGEPFAISETPRFAVNGAMFDVSRNAVMTVQSVERMLRTMALMGLNMMMLYTEDTYTMDNRPYFGYLRGKYSYEELKRCDEYAAMFGIEMIPCIQTLAHLKLALRWDDAAELRDTDDILLAGRESTYAFIEDMLRAASAPFRSRRIHIGMDEAHRLGLGQYLELNGYRPKTDIMREHLRRVRDIAAKLGLQPMIWSDMYFGIGALGWDYYNPQHGMDDDAFGDVALVYWDYFHHDSAFYAKQLQRHKQTGKRVLFSSCTWTWTGFGANYGKTFATVNAGLRACKEEGIAEVFTTVWLNYGAETNVFSSLLGLQLHAEHGYSREVDMDRLERRFECCAGASCKAFRDLGDLDETPGTDEGNLLALNSDGLHPANPSHYLLWQDLLLGLFDKHLEGLDLAGHYARLAENMRGHAAANPAWSCVFEVPWKLAAVLQLKSELGLIIKRLYDRNDLQALQTVARHDLPELKSRVVELRDVHRKHWFGTYKPFGWEVLDIRYGGLLQRIDTVATRLADYAAGNIEKIEELEEEKLPAVDATAQDESGVSQIFFCWYDKIVTACATD